MIRKIKSLAAKNVKSRVTVDFRIISAVLLGSIVAMLIVWKPWTGGLPQKTVSVTGEAVIEETPDEYRFSPTFSSTGESTADATEKVTEIGEQAVVQLKSL